MKLWRAYIELFKEHKTRKKKNAKIKKIWNFIEQKRDFSCDIIENVKNTMFTVMTTWKFKSCVIKVWLYV